MGWRSKGGASTESNRKMQITGELFKLEKRALRYVNKFGSAYCCEKFLKKIMLGELLLSENGWTNSSDLLAVLPKFFWATFKANFMTLATPGACHVTYSQQGVK